MSGQVGVSQELRQRLPQRLPLLHSSHLPAETAAPPIPFPWQRICVVLTCALTYPSHCRCWMAISMRPASLWPRLLAWRWAGARGRREGMASYRAPHPVTSGQMLPPSQREIRLELSPGMQICSVAAGSGVIPGGSGLGPLM